MAELIRDPFTGQYTFANPTTAVVNNVTGQTASSAQAISNTGTALGATTPQQQANVATYFTPQATLKDVAPQINQAYSGTYTPPPAPPPTPSVSSATLNPPTTTNFQTPADTSPAPAAAAAYSTAAPDFSLSGSQQGAQDLNSQLQALNNQLVGKSAYQTEQESKYGVPGFQSTLTDLGSQLTALKNEAAAIPLQLQQGAAERGVTTPVLGRQENSRLRTNAIAALGVSSLMAAAQGQLANAQSLADKAVQQKYGPIEEQIEAGMKNLNLIMNSPQYTQDEKKQAFQQQQYLQQQADAVAQQKADYANTLKISADAASNIANFTPTAEYKTPAQALQAMQNASPQQALQIASATGLVTQNASAAGPASIQEYQFAVKQGYTGTYLDFKNSSGAKNLQFVGGTANQPSGYFDPNTGKFTPYGGGGGTGTYSGEFANVTNAAAGLVGAERGAASKTAINSALQQGDYVTAYALIANNVEESLTGTPKTKFADSRTDYTVMLGMREAIQQYVDAGGDTGILKGTADDIARKIGQLATDPEFAALSTLLTREFQSYRVNMTGAAFSPAESQDYAKVNPSGNKSLDLNLAVIDGALNQLENRVTSTINTRVPGADALYQKVSAQSSGGSVNDGLSDEEAYAEYLRMIQQ